LFDPERDVKKPVTTTKRTSRSAIALTPKKLPMKAAKQKTEAWQSVESHNGPPTKWQPRKERWANVLNGSNTRGTRKLQSFPVELKGPTKTSHDDRVNPETSGRRNNPVKKN